jgi:chromosome segregation ATPase
MELPDGTATGLDESLAERVDSLASWLNDIETRLRAAEVATGDEKTAKELRRAIEALSKHDPKLEKRVTDHVTVVTQRFDTLASTVATTAAALAAREGEIAGLRRELEEGQRRIEELARKPGGGADAKELARLRGIVDALSAQRPARTSDSRVDELGANVRMLAERVDSLTATVSANAAALGPRDKELAAIRERLDAGTLKVETVAAEIHRLERDDTLAERLDALQVALVEANGAIADREAEATQLRARIDEAYARAGDALSELQRSVGEVAGRVDELQSVPASTAAALEQRTAALDGRIDAIAERLDAASADVAKGLDGIAQRDAQLAGLYRDVEAERARVDTLIAELKDELDGLPDPAARHAELEASLESVRADVGATATRMQELEASHSARAGGVEDALARLAGRLDAADREREDSADRLRQADEAWLQERDWVRRQLERLAEAQEQTSHATGSITPALDGLRTRLDELEAGQDGLASHVAALAATVAEAGSDGALDEIRARVAGLEEERTGLGARLDALSAAAEAAGEPAPPEELVALAGRVDDVERRGTAVATELAQSTALWASELAALGERLDRTDAGAREQAAARLDLTDRLVGGLAARLDELERAAAAGASAGEPVAERVEELAARLAQIESGAISPVGSLEEIRALVDEVVARTAAPGPDLRSELDALVKRVELAERTASSSPATGDEAGDGRFRLELRSLELRMEHAESAARENREAVLTQLERLASRVEWRLQRLEEAAQAESYVEPGETGAQIVPIRGGADTT